MKPIAHYESKYLIGEDGQVLNLRDNSYKPPSINPNGYVKVLLSLNGESTQQLVHRLVALHFLPNPYGYTQVNHIDGDKENNHVLNLEWCSAMQNIQHALETGLRGGYMSQNEKEAHLKEVFDGALVSTIAFRIGRHPNTLSKMLRVVSDRTGVRSEWDALMSSRRKDVAIRNLAKVNHKHT